MCGVLGSDGSIKIIAGTGVGGFNGDGGLAINAQLHNPHAVFSSSDGHLYIADWGNNRVRVLRLENNEENK